MAKQPKPKDKSQHVPTTVSTAGKARKQARIEAQEARTAANRERRANGEATPWEAAKEARKARRAADAKTQQRARAKREAREFEVVEAAIKEIEG